MDGLEHSCRKSSEIFTKLAEKAGKPANRKLLYELALDCYCSASMIENLRAVEFFFSEMYPEEYKNCLRVMSELAVQKLRAECEEDIYEADH